MVQTKPEVILKLNDDLVVERIGASPVHFDFAQNIQHRCLGSDCNLINQRFNVVHPRIKPVQQILESLFFGNFLASGFHLVQVGGDYFGEVGGYG
jgi:hypothetical protein